MSKIDDLKETGELAQVMAEKIQVIQKDIDDYDLSRMLKKVEAEILDLQYNLSIAIRLLEKN